MVDVENCLVEHKKLLLTISKYLSNNSRIDKDKIFEMTTKYFADNNLQPVNFHTKETYYDFKNKLDKM